MGSKRAHRIAEIVVLAAALVRGVTAQLRSASPADSSGDQCANGVLQMSLKAVPTPGPLRPLSEPIPVSVWAGLLEIKLKNISTLMVDLGERADFWEYTITVLDEAGKLFPKTEYGKTLRTGEETPGMDYFGPNAVFHLAPAQELKNQIYLTQVYKIEPGHAYTVRLKRESGLPRVDQAGKPIEHPGLSCSLTIPAGPLVVVN